MTATRGAGAVGLAVIGGGPAGLMVAESARAAGVEVDLFDGMGSVGRKFLLAGKGGLNLTHAESHEDFVGRYAGREPEIGRWLQGFDAAALRDWARGLGIDSFVGTSGRVFPADLKAAPLLRGWIRRLRDSGVRFHVRHRCRGWDEAGALVFDTPEGERHLCADAVVLALGGGSWPELGSDGAWQTWLGARGVAIAPLKPSNCGFDVAWSEHFSSRFAGEPLKPVTVIWRDAPGAEHRRQGEFVITATGIEGGIVYALSAMLREAIERNGEARIELDLVPGRGAEKLDRELARPRAGRSLSEFLRRAAGLDSLRTNLLYECASKAELADPKRLAQLIKALPLKLDRAAPIEHAISTAGGVRFDSLDSRLMLRDRPGVFCAGEMIDWEAPTGGYLLTACFASGRVAGAGAVEWLREQSA